MGLSTGRPWQAKHREIGIDLTAKKGWNQENLLYLAAEGVEYFPEH
jgi:hypothetical protein